MNNNQAIAYAVIAIKQLGYTIEQMKKFKPACYLRWTGRMKKQQKRKQLLS